MKTDDLPFRSFCPVRLNFHLCPGGDRRGCLPTAVKAFVPRSRQGRSPCRLSTLPCPPRSGPTGAPARLLTQGPGEGRPSPTGLQVPGSLGRLTHGVSLHCTYCELDRMLPNGWKVPSVCPGKQGLSLRLHGALGLSRDSGQSAALWPQLSGGSQKRCDSVDYAASFAGYMLSCKGQSTGFVQLYVF